MVEVAAALVQVEAMEAATVEARELVEAAALARAAASSSASEDSLQVAGCRLQVPGLQLAGCRQRK